jgi:ABC-type polysaccharide/polyol phosphate export permease
MYATPVVYPMATEGMLGYINKVNPVTYLIEIGRATVMGGPFTSLPLALVITFAALAMLVFGWAIFHITMPRVVERMGM